MIFAALSIVLLPWFCFAELPDCPFVTIQRGQALPSIQCGFYPNGEAHPKPSEDPETPVVKMFILSDETQPSRSENDTQPNCLANVENETDSYIFKYCNGDYFQSFSMSTKEEGRFLPVGKTRCQSTCSSEYGGEDCGYMFIFCDFQIYDGAKVFGDYWRQGRSQVALIKSFNWEFIRDRWLEEDVGWRNLTNNCDDFDMSPVDVTEVDSPILQWEDLRDQYIKEYQEWLNLVNGRIGMVPANIKPEDASSPKELWEGILKQGQEAQKAWEKVIAEPNKIVTPDSASYCGRDCITAWSESVVRSKAARREYNRVFGARCGV